MDLDLDTLKSEILNFLEASGFAVFRTQPGSLEGQPMICWDCDRYPDYRMFLETASKTGAKIIQYASREFELGEIEDSIELLEDCTLTHDERRDYERRLRTYRKYDGITCSLELAFDHNDRMYVYEVRPDWYNEFLELCDDISCHLPLEEDEENGDSLGGFYSNN